MMSTGSFPFAWSPHHGGRNHENRYCNHDRHDQYHPGDSRDTLTFARADGVGQVCLAANWLNIRWRT